MSCELIPCDACDGIGEFDCASCGGDDTRGCSECEEYGTVDCEDCGGGGVVGR